MITNQTCDHSCSLPCVNMYFDFSWVNNLRGGRLDPVVVVYIANFPPKIFPFHQKWFLTFAAAAVRISVVPSKHHRLVWSVIKPNSVPGSVGIAHCGIDSTFPGDQCWASFCKLVLRSSDVFYCKSVCMFSNIISQSCALTYLPRAWVQFCWCFTDVLWVLV